MAVLEFNSEDTFRGDGRSSGLRICAAEEANLGSVLLGQDD